MPDHEIESCYKLGFDNLNCHWKYFDEVYLFETSAFKKEPNLILTVLDHQIDVEDEIPQYLNSLVPSILN